MPITGTAIIRVEHETGGTIQEFTRTIGNLAPGSTHSFAAIWDTANAPAGAYHVAGYVLYDGQAAGPVSLAVNARAKKYIYLPLIMRGAGSQ